MFHDVPQTFLYAFTPPRRISLTQLRENFTAMTEAANGPVTRGVVEVDTNVIADDIAWTAAIMHVTASMKDGSELDITYRATDLWRNFDGRWAVIHEHASLPVNPDTGKADLHSRPRPTVIAQSCVQETLLSPDGEFTVSRWSPAVAPQAASFRLDP